MNEPNREELPHVARTLDEYQLAVAGTAFWRSKFEDEMGPRLHINPYLDLAGETGEVVEKVKKLIRDKGTNPLGGAVGNEDRIAIGRELGDVLWAVAQIAYDLDIPLNDIAHDNMVKVYDRHKRGVVHGSGDNR